MSDLSDTTKARVWKMRNHGIGFPHIARTLNLTEDDARQAYEEYENARHDTTKGDHDHEPDSRGR